MFRAFFFGSPKLVLNLQPLKRNSVAWPFLQILGDLIILGADGVGVRCYDDVWWGYDATTLFGRHKGHLSHSDTHRAVQKMSAYLAGDTPTETWLCTAVSMRTGGGGKHSSHKPQKHKSQE